MSTKKKKTLEKLILKIFNRKAYREYKENIKRQHDPKFLFVENSRISVQNVNNLKELKAGATLNFCHSGHAGDIIYSLPTLKKIAELKQIRVNLYLKVGQTAELPSHYHTHPQGMFLLNEGTASNLISLVNKQSYIQECRIHNNEKIDINLDSFRDGFLQVSSGSIPRWYGYITGVNPDLWMKWIDVKADESFRNSVIFCRSTRYLNENIDFSFLKKYDHINFIGLRSEFEIVSKINRKIKWVEVKDFAEMASVIAGCKLFIGNQSLPYSLAEGLKVPRILEVFPNAPNVIPEGPNGYDYYLQEHLEFLVDRLYN